ncbi:MAG: efflux RND transporter periplasmic adaptor subunit [Betaproteobacteria bacterium HGW-Betaproteobacteria-8]|nr:MAG: efflux RND transporter periplasmic adaptor subunit [Betaproteobacteria bacterium HGW-Betaproteobacteria-8]
MPRRRYPHLLMVACLAMTMAACGKSETPKESRPSATLVSVATAETIMLEVREETVGTLEGLIDPTVSAEVAGRVLRVEARPGQRVKKDDVLVLLDPTDLALQRREAQAEVGRIEALLVNQERTLERNQALVEKQFISKNALDDISTQKSALKNELEAARARLASIEYNGSKTRVLAPVDGVIEVQIVSPGDFVSIGSPLMKIVSNQRLRAHLPFPERVAPRIRAGLKVRLTTPASPDEVISEVREMKPLIGTNNRAIDVLADVTGKEDWQSGASVNGVVVIGTTEAVVVPEQSVVLRPAGDVVYVIKDNKAEQRVVKAGLRQEGMVEIIDGIVAGEVVAVDGASFLTDQAEVSIQGQTVNQNQPPAKENTAS